ncbi:hypothetical protein Pfo_024572, partial [Paulownia fortunei]
VHADISNQDSPPVANVRPLLRHKGLGRQRDAHADANSWASPPIANSRPRVRHEKLRGERGSHEERGLHVDMPNRISSPATNVKSKEGTREATNIPSIQIASQGHMIEYLPLAIAPLRRSPFATSILAESLPIGFKVANSPNSMGLGIPKSTSTSKGLGGIVRPQVK